MADQKRMTITFLAPTVEDIDWLAERTGLNQADTVNRSVRVHATVERELAKGRNLLFEDPETGITERVVII